MPKAVTPITLHDEISDSEGLLAHFANKEWETRIEALHLPFGPITTGAIGIQFGNRDFSVTGPEADFLHPTTTDSFAAYIFEEIGLSERFSLQGAVRVEWTSITGDTDALGFFDRKFTPVSYALGAVFKATSRHIAVRKRSPGRLARRTRSSFSRKGRMTRRIPSRPAIPI